MSMDSDSSCDEMPKPKKLKTLAFHVECTKGNNVLHQFVLDNSYPNKSGSESYITAVLRSMINTPINELNAEGHSPLHLAVRKNNLLMVKKLIFCLEDINVNVSSNIYPKETALHMAVQLPLYIAEAVNLGAGDSPLRPAVHCRYLEIVKLLVWNNADVNAKDLQGQTPLHYAAYQGCLEIVQFLIDNNANINSKDACDYTPLYFAVHSGNLRKVQILVQNYADVNAKNIIDRIPLHDAIIKSGNLEIVKFLIGNNANIDAKDIFQLTPLHLAVKLNLLEIVQFLVCNNADINVTDVDNKTPLHYAVNLGNLEIAEFLVDHNAI